MDTSSPTTPSTAPRRSMAATCAYAAAVLFAAHLATYFVPAIRDVTVTRSIVGAVLLAVLALAQHLVVFPIVSAVQAPRFAQLAGYAWLVVDMGTDVLQLGGAPKSLYLVLRLGINLVAALWIASASLRARGAMRSLGVFVAADFACYSFVALLSPLAFVVALPSLILLPLWFVLAGRQIARLGLPANRAARVLAAIPAGT
ncbi:MAG: hypothetical protein ACXVCO_20440 [Ktedonobacterales bacterium]